MDILKEWDLTRQELDEIVSACPGLRGSMLRYVAEYKLRKMWFSGPKFGHVIPSDDPNLTCDGYLGLIYKATTIKVELKSLRTASVRKTGDGLRGTIMCDAGDTRNLRLPDGSEAETGCLLAGQFDILAVNVFEFEKKWNFAFALNDDLPRSTFAKHTEYQRRHLLKMFVRLTWPLKPPFTDDPRPLLEQLARRRQRKRR